MGIAGRGNHFDGAVERHAASGQRSRTVARCVCATHEDANALDAFARLVLRRSGVGWTQERIGRAAKDHRSGVEPGRVLDRMVFSQIVVNEKIARQGAICNVIDDGDPASRCRADMSMPNGIERVVIYDDPVVAGVRDGLRCLYGIRFGTDCRPGSVWHGGGGRGFLGGGQRVHREPVGRDLACSIDTQSSGDESHAGAELSQRLCQRQAALDVAKPDLYGRVDAERHTDRRWAHLTLNSGTSGSQRRTSRSEPAASAWPIIGSTSAYAASSCSTSSGEWA